MTYTKDTTEAIYPTNIRWPTHLHTPSFNQSCKQAGGFCTCFLCICPTNWFTYVR